MYHKYVGSLAAASFGRLLHLPTGGWVAYYDASRTKVNTLTDTSRRIVEGVEGTVEDYHVC